MDTQPPDYPVTTKNFLLSVSSSTQYRRFNKFKEEKRERKRERERERERERARCNFLEKDISSS